MNTDKLMAEAINLGRKNLIEWKEYGEALKSQLDSTNAKLSERKTVHEWLNAKGVTREENGKPLCLLRRLAIALDVHGEALNESNVQVDLPPKESGDSTSDVIGG